MAALASQLGPRLQSCSLYLCQGSEKPSLVGLKNEALQPSQGRFTLQGLSKCPGAGPQGFAHHVIRGPVTALGSEEASGRGLNLLSH